MDEDQSSSTSQLGTQGSPRFRGWLERYGLFWEMWRHLDNSEFHQDYPGENKIENKIRKSSFILCSCSPRTVLTLIKDHYGDKLILKNKISQIFWILEMKKNNCLFSQFCQMTLLAGLNVEILELSFLLEQGSVNWATCLFSKIELNLNTAMPIHLHIAAAFMPKKQSWVVAIEIVGLAKPQIFTIWSFKKKFADPCLESWMNILHQWLSSYYRMKVWFKPKRCCKN